MGGRRKYYSVTDSLRAEGVIKMKWISCDFRMPKNGKDVLVYVPEVGILVGKYEKEGYWTVYGTYGTADVTYWQPLPHEPKED